MNPALTTPGEVEPNEFQRALVSILAYFNARFRKSNACAPITHEADVTALVWITHAFAKGNQECAKDFIDDLFLTEAGQCTSLHECVLYWRWGRQVGARHQMPKLPLERREAIEAEIQHGAAHAVRVERERLAIADAFERERRRLR